MRYIDSGSRVANSALGSWFQDVLTQKITELRLQTGFFGVEGLRVLAEPLQRLSRSGSLVKALVGSNDGETVGSHVTKFVELLGLPRTNASLGVVNYAGAFFHPKVYHLRRADGGQCAYVGSANLTSAGVSGLHVEAGVILDTDEGDAAATLDEIAQSIDEWFHLSRPGLELVRDQSDVTRLLNAGILSLLPAPRAPHKSSGTSSGSNSRPRLRSLVVNLPPLPFTAASAPTPSTSPVGKSAFLPHPPVTTHNPPYPAYLFFAPHANMPTRDADALTGQQLPPGTEGIIIRWNRDSGRHWRNAAGTANISLPVTTLHTLRFGRNGSSARAPGRPRAEFSLFMRYISATATIVAAPAATNIMAYGYEPSDPGNKDIRMVVPKPPASSLLAQLNGSAMAAPAEDDLALLQWPTQLQPSFRLTAVARGSSLYSSVDAIMAAAISANQLIGHVGSGACWLPAGTSPSW